jgi:transcriptional regulator NrdR family protein
MPKPSNHLLCPQCGGKSIVLVTRARAHHITRHRECRECGLRFTSRETAVIFLDAQRRKATELDRIVERLKDYLRGETDELQEEHA